MIVVSGAPTTERIRQNVRRTEPSYEAELRDQPPLELADVTRMPLRKLSELDDSVLDAMLERLLPACAGIGDRLWNQGGVAQGDRGEAGT